MKQNILSIDFIKSCVEKVAKLYDLKKVSLFGSYASGKETGKSDIDLLVEFNDDDNVTLFTMAGLQLKLEELTGKDVDVIHMPMPKSSIIVINEEVPLYG